MQTYAELEAQFQRRVAWLRRRCPHGEAEWLPFAWAPGHYGGVEVRVCSACGKTLERRNPGIPAIITVTSDSSPPTSSFTITSPLSSPYTLTMPTSSIQVWGHVT